MFALSGISSPKAKVYRKDMKKPKKQNKMKGQKEKMKAISKKNQAMRILLMTYANLHKYLKV